MKEYEPLKQKSVVPDTILIADDDEINRAILNEIFKDTYRIEEAENGEECLKKLLAQKERICALLLDVVMPVMDGLQLLKELKDRNLLEIIPVFLITAEANERIIKEGYDLGVMDVVLKPVTPHIVRRRVDSIVELFVSRRKMRRIVQRQNMELIDKDVEIMRTRSKNKRHNQIFVEDHALRRRDLGRRRRADIYGVHNARYWKDSD